VSCVSSGRPPGNSGLADFLTRVGNNFARQRQYARAREAYSRAVAACEYSAEALINLGRLAIREGRYEEAERHFALVLRASVENYSALVGLAMVHLHGNRYAEAARFAERAARAGQAEACLDSRPYCLLAAAHRGRGDDQQEQKAIDEGLTLLPDADELCEVRAAFNLRRRHWDEGWKDNEHRQSRRAMLRRFDEVEEWNCSAHRFAEKCSDAKETNQETLLIFGEGPADQQLFFGRYIPEVTKQYRGQRVVFCTRPELARFFARLGVSIVTSEQEVERVMASSGYCRWVGLRSLPHKLRMPEPIEAVRYRANREEVERFATLIGNSEALRVGIYWSDDSRQTSATISFAGFEPLFNLPGCSFYSLRQTPQSTNKAVLDLAAHCHDVADFAAAIENLDLVITTDSYVAHLAAIAGKPTWVLDAGSSNWMWGGEGDEVQWYPTVRVFRCCAGSSLDNLMETISAALSTTARISLRNEFDTRIEPKPRPGKVSTLVTKPCRYGEMVFHHTDQWLGRSLDLYGEWSESEVELFRQVVKPGDVVIEAGANVGALTIPLANIVGDTGRVHAFEPQQDNFDCLAWNVLPLRNVTLWPTALAAGKYRISYAAVDPDKVCNLGSTELSTHRAILPTRSDITATIDELFPFASVSFIKADVEGMELEILQGAAATVNRCRPILYIEDDRKQNSAALRAWLISHGYRLYRHTPPLYNPENWRGSQVNVFGRTVSINLLCIPNTRYELKNTTDLLQRVRA
jgi:FkbM family methyltransferase